MKYLMLVLVMVVTSVSADLVDLKYWEDPYPYCGSIGTWHGINFEYSDFDTSEVGWDSMEIYELSIRFINAEPNDSVIVFIIDASSLPPHCPLADLYNHPDVVAGFTITPLDGMHNYALPEFTIVDDADWFWVLIYTEKAFSDDGAQLCIDPGVLTPPYHTYRGCGFSDPPWWTGVGLTINEAHVTVIGEMLCMSLEPSTWGSLKTSF